MKIQLDYDTKTITLEDNVNLGDFFEKIKKILPDFKEWKLDTKTVINWNNPMTIPYVPYCPPYEPYPWYPVWGTDTGKVTFNDCATRAENTGAITSGTYQLEVN